MTNDPNLLCVERAMKQSGRLMNDHAWNGEEEHYLRQQKNYEYYRDLFMRGILYIPRF